MKISVKLDIDEQKKKQTEVWSILVSTLPPAPKKTAVRLIIAGALLVVALAVSIVSAVAVTDANRAITVLAVILLVAGVVTLSGALYDLLAKRHKKKRILADLSVAVDAMYDGIPDGATAQFDVGAENFAAVYAAADGETLKKFAGKLTECAVVSIGDTLCVDFTDTDAYCFDAAASGKDELLALKKLLLMKHESYRDVECDERGKYYLAGND